MEKFEKYVREQDKKAKLVKLYEKVGDIISPLEILQTLGNTLPPNNKNPKFEIRYFNLDNESLKIEGVSDNQSGVSRIERALKSFAKDGKVNKAPSVTPDEPGKSKFSYQLKVKRKH